MVLAPMRYKNFTWPHNPKTYEVKYQRRLAVNPIPFGGYTAEDMGVSLRIIRGEGEFAGEGAYDSFKRLAALFADGTPGVLVHPVWQSENAYFTALDLLQEPREDYVRYTFEFAVCYEKKADMIAEIVPEATIPTPKTTPDSERKAHIVRKGDTLWAIARDNGMSLERLISLNPQISNPNKIYAGDKVYLN